jgi:S1-C subfamily serine protease
MILKALVNLTTACLVLIVMGFGMIKLPQLHSKILRKYVGDRVVKVMGPRGGGSGFAVQAPSGRTYILTNAHVCLVSDKRDNIRVVRKGAKDYVVKKVLHRMKDHDLCLIDGLKGMTGLKVADTLEIGEVVALIGHPRLRPLTFSRGEYIGATKVRLTFGMNLPERLCIGKTILAKDVKNPWYKFMLTAMGAKSLCVAELKANMLNAISYKGNSGSPVVNFFGNLTGVLFAGGRDVTDAYVVPLATIKEFLKDK